MRDLIDVLTDVPTQEKGVVLNHFRASGDSASALALAQRVLARPALDPGESQKAVLADSSYPMHQSTCLCGHVEQISMYAWQRLLDTYWKHYSADLPFLHASSFLRICYRYGQNGKPRYNKSDCRVCCDSSLREYTPLLLAFLALTSRHHPDLVVWTHKYGENVASNHTESTDVYASSAERHLKDAIASHKTYEYSSLHARLMLVLYNCSMARCSKALLLLGEAVVVARSMNLDQEANNASGGSPQLQATFTYESTMTRSAITLDQGDNTMNLQDTLLDAEIRVRTFWSCYVLDSQLHLGKGRRRLLQDQTLSVQRHATHDEHWFGTREDINQSQMAPLGRKESSMNASSNLQHPYTKAEESKFPDATPDLPFTSCGVFWPCSRISMTGGETSGRGGGYCHESPLSQYIKAIDLLSRISSWALHGGRRCVTLSVEHGRLLTACRIETRKPWDIASNWNVFLRRLLKLNHATPAQLQMTSSSFRECIGSRTSSHTIHMHLARLLCQLLLHWEFIPFLPVNCRRPQGPLEPITLLNQTSDAPAGFWKSSAQECFTAAQKILFLTSTWRTADALPLTPFIAYAVHTAAFIDSYGASFPWMCSHALDPLYSGSNPDEHDAIHLNTQDNLRKKLVSSGFEELKIFVRLADEWTESLISITEYFETFKTDFNAAKARGSHSKDYIEMPLRHGGAGAGSSEYSLFERQLRNFGSFVCEIQGSCI